MHHVKYDKDPKVYEYTLLDDLGNHDLKSAQTKGEFLVEKNIRHTFISEEDDQEYWFPAKIIASNKTNWLHSVQYES